MNTKYQSLLNSLAHAKEDELIILLHRGVTKKFAFEKLQLDVRYNTIGQFAQKLFFFGEKSRYFWNDKLKPSGQFEFAINDISSDFFRYIFNEFNKLIENKIYKGTSYYFKKNKKAITFFNEKKNIEIFANTINQLPEQERTFVRNYYLTILHQLGESKYKDNSQFISSSTEEIVANRFSSNEIVINFWELNFTRDDITKQNKNLPKFIGKPYKNQKELSVFTVILPQFIYSFKFGGKLHKNPAIDGVENFESVIFSGLDIRQDNFPDRLREETNYSSGVMTNGITYKEYE